MKAIVTGASRGIGRATARTLVAAGFDVIGTSRNPSAIPAAERLGGVRYFPLDLRDGKSIETFAAAAGEVDVLVNNAGASQIGAIEETPVERMRSLFEANLFGSVRLTQLLIPSMRARRSGAIVNVASFAGVSPVPFLSVYAASKSAFIAMSRSLRVELAPWGIRVAVVAPFDIHTSIPLEVCLPEGSSYAEPLGRVREARDRFLAEAPDPQIVADKVLSVVSARAPRLFNPVGKGANLTAFLVRHLPGAAVESAVKKRFGIG